MLPCLHITQVSEHSVPVMLNPNNSGVVETYAGDDAAYIPNNVLLVSLYSQLLMIALFMNQTLVTWEFC